MASKKTVDAPSPLAPRLGVIPSWDALQAAMSIAEMAEIANALCLPMVLSLRAVGEEMRVVKAEDILGYVTARYMTLAEDASATPREQLAALKALQAVAAVMLELDGLRASPLAQTNPASAFGQVRNGFPEERKRPSVTLPAGKA